MDLFVITYRLGGEPLPRTLYLNVHAKRGSARSVVRTLISYEFPSVELPEMKFRDWNAEEILGRFGISAYECIYRHMPGFQGINLNSGVMLRSVV
jgi:hypothetical protein